MIHWHKWLNPQNHTEKGRQGDENTETWWQRHEVECINSDRNFGCNRMINNDIKPLQIIIAVGLSTDDSVDVQRSTQETKVREGDKERKDERYWDVQIGKENETRNKVTTSIHHQRPKSLRSNEEDERNRRRYGQTNINNYSSWTLVANRHWYSTLTVGC